MNNGTPIEVTAPPVWCFTLVMAEVIFMTELGPQHRRTQFIPKSDGEIFPRSRLQQIQQMAATTVMQELHEQSNGAFKDVSVEAVYLLGVIPCGWMTEEQFLEAQTSLTVDRVTAQADADAAETQEVEADGAGAANDSDNVVPLRTN